MDIQMRRMDGLVLRQREADLRLQPVPVIALTANAMTVDRERCLAGGVNGYLPKPLELRALDKALAHYCTARAALAGELTG
jgi:CheY-like chemotaxis protein